MLQLVVIARERGGDVYGVFDLNQVKHPGHLIIIIRYFQGNPRTRD